jgi:hypothetical protein
MKTVSRRGFLGAVATSVAFGANEQLGEVADGWHRRYRLAPSITTAPLLPSATVGSAYSQALAATGGTPPYKWAITGNTPGNWLSLNASTGVLSGIPNTAGTQTAAIEVTDSAALSSAPRNFSVAVNAAVPSDAALSITTAAPLPAATVGSAYGCTLTATGGTPPYSWTITADTPATGGWLSISASGVLSGTPGTAETESVTVQVQDASGSTAENTFPLTVNAATANATAGPASDPFPRFYGYFEGGTVAQLASGNTAAGISFAETIAYYNGACFAYYISAEGVMGSTYGTLMKTWADNAKANGLNNVWYSPHLNMEEHAASSSAGSGDTFAWLGAALATSASGNDFMLQAAPYPTGSPVNGLVGSSYAINMGTQQANTCAATVNGFASPLSGANVWDMCSQYYIDMACNGNVESKYHEKANIAGNEYISGLFRDNWFTQTRYAGAWAQNSTAMPQPMRGASRGTPLTRPRIGPTPRARPHCSPLMANIWSSPTATSTTTIASQASSSTRASLVSSMGYSARASSAPRMGTRRVRAPARSAASRRWSPQKRRCPLSAH